MTCVHVRSGSAGSEILFNHVGCLCDDPNLCWPQSENSTMYELTNNVSEWGPCPGRCLWLQVAYAAVCPARRLLSNVHHKGEVQSTATSNSSIAVLICPCPHIVAPAGLGPYDASFLQGGHYSLHHISTTPMHPSEHQQGHMLI
jgi:hypothetical protein